MATDTALRPDARERQATDVPADAAPAGAAAAAGEHRLTHILVATDGAPNSDAALVLGWVIAERTQARMDVVTTYQRLPAHPAEVAPPVEEPDLERMLREDLCDRVQRQLVRVGVSVPPDRLLLRTGHPGATVIRTAEETGVQLVVLGLRPHGVVQRVLGPETALHIIHGASVPVLAVANRLRWLPPRAVVAVDFSDSSARAAQTTMDLLGSGGSVVLAHVAPRTTIPFAAPTSWEETLGGGLAERLHAFERRLRVPSGMTVERVILRGDPASEIMALTERARAELIATGSHGRSAAGRALLGSVATALLRDAGCSVLVVPPTARG